MSRNERTSARVAKIAAKVLAFEVSGDGNPDVTKMDVAVGFPGVGWDTPFSWRDIRALASSALTQAPGYDDELTSEQIARIDRAYRHIEQGQTQVGHPLARQAEAQGAPEGTQMTRVENIAARVLAAKEVQQVATVLFVDGDWALGWDDIRALARLAQTGEVGAREGEAVMGEHIDAGGKFQSDKYTWCAPDFVPLKVTDIAAQPLLWQYAKARESIDAAFAEDLRARLRAVGFDPKVAMTGWIITHKSVNWECRTEQDALGVLCYLRDFGRSPLGPVSIDPAPTDMMARLVASLPKQEQRLL